MKQPDYWRVTAIGGVGERALARLRAAGIGEPAGTAVAGGGGVPQRKHSFYVPAATAAEAVETLRGALDGAPVSIDADSVTFIGPFPSP